MTKIAASTHDGTLPRANQSINVPPAKKSSGCWQMPAGCKRLGMMLVLGGLLLPSLAIAAGSWVKVQQKVSGGIETMLLLADGTVMAQGGANQATTSWYRLTPGSTGGYTNGTWFTRASMNYTRLFFSSDVLQDGRVFFAGAEYGTGTTNAEVYDPKYDAWTKIPVPSGLIQVNNTNFPNGENSKGFVDSGSVLLSNGNVLVAPVWPAFGNASGNGYTIIFNSASNTFSQGPALQHGIDLDEASMVKLPDDSILVIDSFTNTSERYIPSLNQWIKDANVPVNVYDPYGGEMGAGFLLPNGNAFFLGSTPNTAIYTPSYSTNAGIWTAGPTMPNNLGAPDAPAAMMVNGKILCALEQTPVGTNNGQIFIPPTYFYEFDYNNHSASPNGTFTQIYAPDGSLTDTGGAESGCSYSSRMLDLPDGTVLYTDGNASGQLYVYIPDGSPLAAGKPAVQNFSWNNDGSLHLNGTLFNGLSQGAAYGDDAQMDSNYPLIRFTDANGNVTYGTTYNWSSTGVRTGSAVVTTEATVPAFIAANPQHYSMQIVGNGTASDPVDFYPKDYPTVSFLYPTNGAIGSDAYGPLIVGNADDANYAVGMVRVALNRTADGVWYDFVSSAWGTTTFDFNRNILNASDVSGQHTGWIAQLPAMAAGSYTVQAQSVNVHNHGSPWVSSAFTIESAPVVTFNPLTNSETVFDLSQIGGTINEGGSVVFRIQQYDTSSINYLYWNGSTWIANGNDPSVYLAASVTGGSWSPSGGVALPGRGQLQYGHNGHYFLRAIGTDIAGDSTTNEILVNRSAPDTTPPIVNLDPSSIQAGQVFTNQYLPSVFGLAYDPESGVASVNVLLARNTNPGLVYWDGVHWTATPTNLLATYTAQNISWQLNVPLPSGANLPNASYSLDVSAANNEAPAGTGLLNLNFSVDYHPVFVFTAGSYFYQYAPIVNMNWDNPLNWDQGTVPTPDARVVINNYSPDNTSLGSLQLYRLDLSGGMLTTLGMIITNLNVSGGAIAGGVISLPSSGVLNWSGGILAGTYNVPAGAKMNLTGSADKTLNLATVINNGTVIWNGGSLIGSYGSVITNNATFILQSSSLFDNNASGAGYYPVPTFINNGWLQKTNSNGETIIGNNNGGWSFTQNGTIDIENGALSSQNLFYANGGAVFTGPGETRVDGGSIVMNGTNTIQSGATVELAGGTWTGNNIFTGPGTFVWSGGTIAGANTVGTGAQLSIIGDGPKKIFVGTLTNAGFGQWTGAGPVVCTYGSVFENDGSFMVQNNSSFTDDAEGAGYYALPVFINAGNFVKTNSTGTNTTLFDSVNGGVAFNNLGTVTVQSGVLALGGGGNDTNATFTVAAGSRIDLDGGAHGFGLGTIKLNGPGVTRVRDAATLALADQVVLTNGGTFEIDLTANVSGSGSFGGTGTFNWTGGTISATISLQTNVVLTLTGNDPKNFFVGSLTNTGHALWTGTGPVVCTYGSLFENDGTLTVQNDSSFTDDAQGAGYHPLPVFINNGSFVKTSSVNTTLFDSVNGGVAFNNNGSINLQSGNLLLAGGGQGINGSLAEVAGSQVDFQAGPFSLAGNLSFSGAGSTHVNGGTVTFVNSLNTLSAGGTFEIDTNGNVAGSASFGGTGNFDWTGGTISAALKLQPNVALNVTGNAPKNFFVGSLTNTGNAVWTGTGPVVCTYGSVFENDGVFTVQNDSSFTDDAQDAGYQPLPVFINNGTFRKNTATGITAFPPDNGGVAFNENGTLDVQSGVLSSQAQFYVNGGAIFAGAGKTRIDSGLIVINGINTLLSGATMEFAGGTWSSTTNTFTGAGTFAWSGGTMSGRTTVGAGATLSILGNSPKNLYVGTLVSAGHGLWSGTGPVVCSYGSVFENDGLFTVQNDSAFTDDAQGAGYYNLPVFQNNGTLLKNTTTGTTSFPADNGGVSFNQNGIVDLQTGSLAINGSYTLSGAPQLALVLGGLNPGTQFSQETFAGSALFGGSLSVTLTNGFTPTNGQSFAIATYNSSTGQFSTTQLPPLPVVSKWQLTYNPGSLLLQVVPSTAFQSAALTNGNFNFVFAGQTGSSCLIEVSTNLLLWTPLFTNAPFNGTLNYVDPQTPQFSQRFYRATIFP